MELKEGMYVRTKSGEIGKLEELYCQDSYEHSVRMKINGYYDSYLLKEIDFEKASNNIIDLIEVGDYVNGFRVDEVDYSKSTIYIGNTSKVIEEALFSCDIKSIVTKEQFESMSYKVGE